MRPVRLLYGLILSYVLANGDLADAQELAANTKPVVSVTKSRSKESLGELVYECVNRRELGPIKADVSRTRIYENDQGIRTVRIDFCLRDPKQREYPFLYAASFFGNKNAKNALSPNRSPAVIKGLENRLRQLNTLFDIGEPEIDKYIGWLGKKDNKKYMKRCRFSIEIKRGSAHLFDEKGNFVSEYREISDDFFRAYVRLITEYPKGRLIVNRLVP